MRQIKVIVKYSHFELEELVNDFLKDLADKDVDVDSIYLEFKYDKGTFVCFIEWDE